MDHSHLHNVEEWTDEQVERYWFERARGVDEGDHKDDLRWRVWLLVDFELIDQELGRRIRGVPSLF